MPGFRHSPLEDIQRIRQDLRDRYRDGFPILKELLQNADDARAAQSVAVLCPNGIPEAKHPLLRTAGLCVVNDGDFSADDAQSITSLGLSNKASQAAAAGKFGLGLKSIFHWAEAFFYFSPCSFSKQGSDQPTPSDLLNPWSSRDGTDSRHQDWDYCWKQTRDQDQGAFAGFAKRVLASERWFGLWIPFRATAHCRDDQGSVEPIVKETPQSDFDTLFGKDWQERLADTLPMLRRIQRVGFWRCANRDQGCFEAVAEWHIPEAATRLRADMANSWPGADNQQTLKGLIQGKNSSLCVSFAGRERLADHLDLKRLNEHRNWPSQSAIGRDGGTLQVPEKALPHGAVIFTRQDGKGQATIRIQHAVFLPLGEPEELDLKGGGTYHYGLFLHGYFFVDAGRRSLLQNDSLLEDSAIEQVKNETQVTQLWNHTLLREVVAPLVLPSLEAFVKQEQMDTKEVEALVSSLVRSKTLNPLKPWICREQRFLLRLRQTGSTWERQTWDGEAPCWVKLPFPDFPETELLDLLPSLSAFSVETAVSFAGKSHLAEQSPVEPDDEQLANLLSGVHASAVVNTEHLAWLLKLIPKDYSQRSAESPLTRVLVRMAAQLLGRRMPAEQRAASQWKEFFERLPLEAFVRLPVNSDAIKPEIVAALAGADLSVALLCLDFREAEGSGTIPWANLIRLLQALSEVPSTEPEFIRQRSIIAVRLLKGSNRPTDWTESIGQLPLFAARHPEREVTAFSLQQLREAESAQRLFTDGESWAKDLVKAAPELRPLLLASQVAGAIGLRSASCNAAACVVLLGRAQGLAQDFASRRPLLERLCGERLDAVEIRSALRCLLHGHASAWDNKAPLFDESGAEPVWLTLTRKALASVEQQWRIIADTVANHLRLDEQQRRQLGLARVTDAGVEALLREVGPGKVDCIDLSAEDCDFILQRFKGVDVLRDLNIHHTVGGPRVRIGQHTYVDAGTFRNLPAEFDNLVTRLKPHFGYRRFDQSNGLNSLVKELSWEAVLEIALDQRQPTDWWSTLLMAIGQLGTLRSEINVRVRETAWLPWNDGTPGRPADLLHVPGADKELDRLPATVLGNRIPLLRLRKDVRDHERFETFVKTVLPPPNEVLEALAALLRRDPAWSTGLAGEWTPEQVNAWIEAMKDVPPSALPIATLVQAMQAEEGIRGLLSGFLQNLGGRWSAHTYAEVLKHLAMLDQKSEVRQAIIEAVFLRYLGVIDHAGVEFTRTTLRAEGVKLPNADGGWKPPAQLAPPTEGLAEADCVDRRWAEAMPNLSAECAVLVQRGDSPEVVHNSGTWNEMARELRRLFEPWRRHLPSPEPIGAFLSLITSPAPVAGLAAEFFQVHESGAVSQWFKELDPDLLAELRNQLADPVPLISVIHSREVRVRSLLGDEFYAHRQVNPSCLIFGLDPCMEVGTAILVNGVMRPGPRRRVLRFLPLDPEKAALSVPEAVARLQRAAEQILEKCLHRPVNLKELFSRLSQSAQVEVQVAQSLVVEAALGLLRQIGGNAHAGIKKALELWDEARRAEATADSLGIESQRRMAEEKRRNAKVEIRRLLETNSEAQRALLGEVRRKLEQYQYDKSSVLFELWQNADDAMCERERLDAITSIPSTAYALVFVKPDAVQFVHFGRLINEYRRPSSKSFDHLGWNRDLEKMVVQSISDKAEDGTRPGTALTGKFGLGFKSVFLVSDSPEVLSGSVDFVIQGGTYPIRLSQARRDTLVAELKELAPSHWRRGTLIRLPWRTDGEVKAEEVLSLFRRLAPLLVVFSRRLKRLRLQGQAGVEEIEVRWQPRGLAQDEEVECGEVSLLGDDKIRQALVLSRRIDNDRVQLLLALGDDGFVPLPDDVPVFWVTAPTRDPRGFGFAVNGPFEPDVGRVQLALQSNKNVQLAGELAVALCNRLGRLHANATENWDALRGELQLSHGTTPERFWQSLWEVLGKRFADKCRKDDDGPVAKLSRRILWESEADGLQAFYRQCAALPTGLVGDYAVLTKLSALRFVASGVLDREDVFRVVSKWTEFCRRVAIGVICSKQQVASTLESLGVNLESPEQVSLTTAVEWELGEQRLADSELAGILGGLLTPNFMKALREGKPQERDEREHESLRKLLDEVQFQAADGSRHKAAKLVVAEGDGVDSDEKLRAAFAPQGCQLNPAYRNSALAFFLASRARLEGNVATLAEWGLLASEEGARIAALRYLLKGQLKERLAEELRSQRDDTKWLWQLQTGLSAWFKTAIPDAHERKEILAHALRLFEDQLNQLAESQEQLTEQQALEAPPKPWTVEELWRWWECEDKQTGDYTLEGKANWPLFHGGDVPSDEQRKAELRRLLLAPESQDGKELWYRLFGYACLISAGRTVTELRRFWLGRLDPENFWKLTGDDDFSKATQAIFENAVTAKFNNMAAGGEQAYFWRRVFYDIRKVHRMVQNDFPAVLLDLIREGHGEHLLQFLRTGHLPGPEQARWIGTFGQSADTPLGFIIRELVRLGVIADEAVLPYAFYVCRPVRRALVKIGRTNDVDASFSGEEWLQWLRTDQTYGQKLLPYYDIPLLHMGITHRGDRMPQRPHTPA